MKIISKFQDYYDIGIAYGVDEKLRFARETAEVKTVGDKLRAITKIVYKKQGQYYRILCHYNVILFCGNAYPFVYVKVEAIHKRDKKFFYTNIDEEYCYSVEALDKYLAQYDRPIAEIKNEYEKVGSYYWHVDDFKKYVQGHFDKSYSEYIALFDTYKVPYFSIETKYTSDKKQNEGKVTRTLLLAKLKQYKFAKVVPPMQAFQEISMYLGQLDLAEDNTVQIEDKYLAQGKGFDCYSFKKMPSKRREKKC